MPFKLCQVLTDTIMMRPFFWIFLLGSIVQAETQLPLNIKNNLAVKSSSVFSIPDKSMQKGADDVPVSVDVVFPNEQLPVIIIEDLPVSPWFIMGKGETEANQLVSFLLNENKNAERNYVESLVEYYITEACTEGINHDVAFAQMCLETGFLRFGGLVIAEMNNFCGLGSIGPGEPGIWFPTMELGVRAHIQHLKAYASEAPLIGELVDPRYRFVRRGSAMTINGLAGTWAADRLYADKLALILERLYRYYPVENAPFRSYTLP